MLNSDFLFDAFLSYAQPDRAAVVRLYEHFKGVGIRAFMDVRNIRPGEEWRFRIESALRHSRLALICLSGRVVTRDGYFQDEILQALEIARTKVQGEVFLIPVRLDDCPVPDRLAAYQWVDCWRGAGIVRLIRQIQSLRGL